MVYFSYYEANITSLHRRAGAGYMIDLEKEGLTILMRELTSDKEWIRLASAIALDDIDEKARPAIPALREALKDQYNKYVVRVANRALNQLEGTNNKAR